TAYAAPIAPGAVTDAPPSASWGTPTTGEALIAEQPDELLALATDDFGVTSVHIIAGEEDLGTMSSAPYETTWTPPASLIGQSVTVMATVTDESGQTSVATEQVPVIAKPLAVEEKLGEEPHVEPKTEAVTPLVVSTPGAGPAPVIAIPATFARSALHSLDLTPSITGSAAIVGVEYLLDNRTICKLTAAPFACHYLPTGADVGLHTLKIIATDASGETTQVSESIRFARFAVHGIALHVKRSGSTLKLTGAIELPARVTHAEGCAKETVHVTFARGRHKSSGVGTVTPRCTFSVSLAHAGGTGKLTASLSGNSVLAPLSRAAKVR
ncbi:MAG TPA: Ig-like domain-containing protein, partial [Candidatus Tumulicola sp.]|nr:Ig-like domain-containing protein [Candidatus Tumulicola sp.]